VEQAYRLGVPADRLAKEIVDQGQLGVAVTEVLRAKALDLLAERAAVTDEAGNPVDVKAITAEARGEAEAQADAEAGDGAEAVTEAGSGDAGAEGPDAEAEGPDAEAEGPDGGAEGEAEAVDSGAGDAEDKPARAGTAKTGKAKAAAAKAAK
jgi:trigger factor